MAEPSMRTWAIADGLCHINRALDSCMQLGRDRAFVEAISYLVIQNVIVKL